MYGNININVPSSSENFEQHFKRTELEGLGARLDTIVEMYQDGELDKPSALDLIDNVRQDIAIESLDSPKQLVSDFNKSVDLLTKVM